MHMCSARVVVPRSVSYVSSLILLRVVQLPRGSTAFSGYGELKNEALQKCKRKGSAENLGSSISRALGWSGSGLIGSTRSDGVRTQRVYNSREECTLSE